MADLLEGYFPVQLQKNFPEGTLLKAVDKLEEEYNPNNYDKITNCNNFDEKALKPMSKEEFLSKLPKNVIKNGKIFTIRDEIAKKFETNNVFL